MTGWLDAARAALHAPVMVFYEGFFVVLGSLMILEALVGKRRGLAVYEAGDLLANLGLYAGYFLINLVWVPLVFAVYSAVHRHAWLDFGGWQLGYHGGWKVWLALFFLEDLCFYVFHRSHHRFGRLWAAHAPHHSSSCFNLSVALRQTWLPFTAVIFWLPLPWLGFDPLMVMTQQMFSLFYQALLHTRLAPSLGVLGRVLNTPAHHSIHHAANAPYVDRNFGGILILWDRCFGTFAVLQPDTPVRYGVTPSELSRNPFRIAWRSLTGLFGKA